MEKKKYGKNENVFIKFIKKQKKNKKSEAKKPVSSDNRKVS